MGNKNQVEPSAELKAVLVAQKAANDALVKRDHLQRVIEDLDRQIAELRAQRPPREPFDLELEDIRAAHALGQVTAEEATRRESAIRSELKKLTDQAANVDQQIAGLEQAHSGVRRQLESAATAAEAAAADHSGLLKALLDAEVTRRYDEYLAAAKALKNAFLRVSATERLRATHSAEKNRCDGNNWLGLELPSIPWIKECPELEHRLWPGVLFSVWKGNGPQENVDMRTEVAEGLVTQGVQGL